MNRLYRNVEGGLVLDCVPASELADEYDTPLYVTCENVIRENYRRLNSALKRNYDKTRILYAAKANTSLSVLRILRGEGAEVDAVSPGEVFLALEAGYETDQIMFTGTSVRDDEMRYLVDADVRMNVDSRSQLERLIKIRVPKLLSVRVNPELGAGHHEHVITAGKIAKFGVWEDDAVEAYRAAKAAGVERFGIQMHIGSGVMEATPHARAVEKLLKIAERVHREIGVAFDFIDIGGGLGIPYRPGEQELDLGVFSDAIAGLFRRRVEEYGLGEPELWVEPGRFLVAESGILLTRVTTVKKTPFRRFVGVDAGFNTLVRPAMYGAYHHILAAGRLDDPQEHYDVYGPLCESGDVFARDRSFPGVSEGDLLAIMDVGAYGFSMSSQYNSRPRPAEVIVKDGRHELVRERESFGDLLRGQRIPSWLR
jgi:diaminopimelate decarboxylase